MFTLNIYSRTFSHVHELSTVYIKEQARNITEGLVKKGLRYSSTAWVKLKLELVHINVSGYFDFPLN